MNTSQTALDFARIAEAISYIKDDFRNQPGLEELSERIGLSPAHFQRLFTNWAGVSPKKFLQYTTIEHAKKLLKEGHVSLFEAAHESGLSGTGRLHDLFVNIEGMTPGEYKNGGEKLTINYSFAESPFGEVLIASTHKGICHLAFAEEKPRALYLLKEKFPKAILLQTRDEIQQNALSIFSLDWGKPDKVRLHLRGTDFQLKVWNALLKIPMGQLSNYGDIASLLHSPNASRAVGTAIGDNPVAFLIPCHRVIRTSGELGGYHWGLVRKAAIIGWEAAKKENLAQLIPRRTCDNL